jgi:hypothetical protein
VSTLLPPSWCPHTSRKWLMKSSCCEQQSGPRPDFCRGFRAEIESGLESGPSENTNFYAGRINFAAANTKKQTHTVSPTSRQHQARHIHTRKHRTHVHTNHTYNRHHGIHNNRKHKTQQPQTYKYVNPVEKCTQEEGITGGGIISARVRRQTHDWQFTPLHCRRKPAKFRQIRLFQK